MSAAQLERKKEKLRNPRVRRIDRRGWEFKRKARFNFSTHHAADAKACRTGLGVTQEELARVMKCSTAAIAQRESGFYSWQQEGEMERFKRACVRAAGL